jgi:hypothetical protein
MNNVPKTAITDYKVQMTWYGLLAKHFSIRIAPRSFRIFLTHLSQTAHNLNANPCVRVFYSIQHNGKRLFQHWDATTKRVGLLWQQKMLLQKKNRLQFCCLGDYPKSSVNAGKCLRALYYPMCTQIQELLDTEKYSGLEYN